MVEPVSGPTKVEKCGEGCIDVWVGQIGDNYWNAACAFFEASSVYNVVSPDAITDAKLEAVYWDDYIQVFVDGHNVFDTHPNIFHCDAHPPNLRFVLFPFTDVTGLLKTKGQHTLKVKVLVGNGGEGYARIRVPQPQGHDHQGSVEPVEPRLPRLVECLGRRAVFQRQPGLCRRSRRLGQQSEPEVRQLQRGAANLRVGLASTAVFRGVEHLHPRGSLRHLRL